MKNLFAKSEVIVYKEIAGGPIFDLYDDDGWIQYNDNKFDGHEVDNLGDEVSLEKIRFLLVEGNNLEKGNSRSNDCGTSWALKKTGPIRASTHNPSASSVHHQGNSLLRAMYVVAVSGCASTEYRHCQPPGDNANPWESTMFLYAMKIQGAELESCRLGEQESILEIRKEE
ncbi:hypothetical protein DY000_02014205 [Brassica cretica]|uniref:Uncharacterized protein n=1 Tax=Brassica cretica TaxID=69181 RepID=A0ABQ7D0M6_BRACR|nr:hypothetical protein DY000_02014205 [Brassica cretica]